MKKIILSVFTIFSFSILLVSCENKSSESKQEVNATSEKAAVQYTCPMHPEVLSNKPGSCPKCGMDLVKK